MYAPKVSLDNETKRQLWNLWDELVWENTTYLIKFHKDLNGYIGKNKKEYERVHERQNFGNMNNMLKIILDFALTNNFLISQKFPQKVRNI